MVLLFYKTNRRLLANEGTDSTTYDEATNQ